MAILKLAKAAGGYMQPLWLQKAGSLWRAQVGQVWFNACPGSWFNAYHVEPDLRVQDLRIWSPPTVSALGCYDTQTLLENIVSC